MTKTNTAINLDKFRPTDFSSGLLNDFLKVDGALRDIYVDNCSTADWKKVVDALIHSDFSVTYFIDDKESALPVDIFTLFVNRENSLKLQVKKDNIIINSFFFCDDQIEFDIDPRDFVNETQQTTIYKFLCLLRDTINKPVKLCDENTGDAPYLIVFPGDNQVHIAKTRFWT